MTRRAWVGRLGWLVVGPSSRVAIAHAAADFESLFDGASLAGWTAIGGEAGGWTVADGLLTARSGKHWLSTNRAFGDFDLRLDYRIERGGNSGVLLRAPHRGDPLYEGLEVQILDDGARRFQQLQPDQFTGSVYGVIAPRRGFARPVGTWNRLGIRLVGASIQVNLNGTRVVDARLDRHPPSIRQRHPGLTRSRGFIGLQAHDAPVWFRNLAVRALA